LQSPVWPSTQRMDSWIMTPPLSQQKKGGSWALARINSAINFARRKLRRGTSPVEGGALLDPWIGPLLATTVCSLLLLLRQWRRGGSATESESRDQEAGDGGDAWLTCHIWPDQGAMNGDNAQLDYLLWFRLKSILYFNDCSSYFKSIIYINYHTYFTIFTITNFFSLISISTTLHYFILIYITITLYCHYPIII
jgi:hypothetical protein